MAQQTFYPAETHQGTVTSFLPLTTTWNPPKGCETKYRLDGPSLMAFDPAYGLDVETDVACGPPVVTTWWEQGLLGGGGSYKTEVSIGPLTCPKDWETVASSTKDSSSVLEMCCPSGYYLFGGTHGQAEGNCLSDVPKSMTLTFGSTADSDPSSWSMATTVLDAQSTVGAIAIKGWNINVPKTTSTHTPTSTAKPGPKSSTSSSTTEQSTESSATDRSIAENLSTSNTGSSEALSTGAKAGIGIGAAVGAIGVVALLVALYLFRQRKKHSQSQISEYPAPVPTVYYTPETRTVQHEMQYQHHYPVELDGVKSPAELGPSR